MSDDLLVSATGPMDVGQVVTVQITGRYVVAGVTVYTLQPLRRL